jgi:prophage maintenance system killer protein
MINKNKIIKTNKIFGGSVYNASNLDFDVDMANQQKNVFRKLAYTTRAMTSGHAFSDANKRTALVVIKSELADNGIRCNQRKLAKSLVRLTDQRESRINIIERRIRSVCHKNMK